MGNAPSTRPGESSRSGNLNTNMLRHRGGDVMSKYQVVKTIGEGSMGAISKAKVREDKIGGSAYQTEDTTLCGGCFGFLGGGGGAKKKEQSVSAGQRREAEVFYALKTIVISRISPEFIEELRNEIDILQNLDHPNIVKAFEVFESRQSIYIVMELCSGGDLYGRLPYSEQESATMTQTLTSAIAYMHRNNVVHRDLKFENIMFESDAPDAQIKVIDFGLSKKFLPDDRQRTMTEGVGTIYTMAPQVLQGVYTSKADLWSVGVIAFMLLSSQKPFYHKRRRKVIDRIMRADFAFRGERWQELSDESKDFVSKLLVLDPKQRMDSDAALKHPWFKEKAKLSARRPSEALMRKVEDNLLAYKDTSALQKVALNVIAHKSSTAEIVELRKAFRAFDSEKNGIISFEEFKLALKESNYGDDELTSIFSSIDVNENGHIVYTEFLAATLGVKGSIEEERVAEAFDRLDSDDSGFISPENLKEILGDGYSTAEIKALIDDADQDKDGQISFEEFKTIFHQKTKKFAAQALVQESSMDQSSDTVDLVGLDAHIPGGKFDSNLSEST